MCRGRLESAGNLDGHDFHAANGAGRHALGGVCIGLKLRLPPPIDRVIGALFVVTLVLILLMAATGYATGILAGLPEIVFAGSGARCRPAS
jgi:hypothetical protein